MICAVQCARRVLNRRPFAKRRSPMCTRSRKSVLDLMMVGCIALALAVCRASRRPRTRRKRMRPRQRRPNCAGGSRGASADRSQAASRRISRARVPIRTSRCGPIRPAPTPAIGPRRRPVRSVTAIPKAQHGPGSVRPDRPQPVLDQHGVDDGHRLSGHVHAGRLRDGRRRPVPREERLAHDAP